MSMTLELDEQGCRCARTRLSAALAATMSRMLETRATPCQARSLLADHAAADDVALDADGLMPMICRWPLAAEGARR